MQEIGAEKVGEDAIAGQRNEGDGVMLRDAGGGVQGDGCPDRREVDVGGSGSGRRGLLLLFDELAREVRAVDFKAFVLREEGFGARPSEIMHEGGEDEGFGVDWAEGDRRGFAGEEEGEGGGAEGVVDDCWGGMFAGVGQGGEDEGSRWEGDVADGEGWEGGRHCEWDGRRGVVRFGSVCKIALGVE